MNRVGCVILLFDSPIYSEKRRNVEGAAVVFALMLCSCDGRLVLEGDGGMNE